MHITDDQLRKYKVNKGELAALFLRLGATAFGGPAVHIAMMRDEVVRRRQWLSDDEFLDLVGTVNLIPGPNSTELAIYIGSRLAGAAGLMIAGISFILPATVIVTLLAWAYISYGSMPQWTGILYGVKAAVIAVVIHALCVLARTGLKSTGLWILASACIAGAALGIHELLVLVISGFSWALFSKLRGRSRCSLTVLPLVLPVSTLSLGAQSAVYSFGLWPLLLFFLKVGLILYGSGYVLLAFLRADLVERWGWLTEAQLLDAIAVGQITPGPVFTTATFIGYLLGGPAGALVATIGIFLPGFTFVALSGLVLPGLQKSSIIRAFLDGINVASLALMTVVTFQLGRSALVDPITALICLISFFLLVQYRINSAWLVSGGAFIGFLAFKVST